MTNCPRQNISFLSQAEGLSQKLQFGELLEGPHPQERDYWPIARMVCQYQQVDYDISPTPGTTLKVQRLLNQQLVHQRDDSSHGWMRTGNRCCELTDQTNCRRSGRKYGSKPA